MWTREKTRRQRQIAGLGVADDDHCASGYRGCSDHGATAVGCRGLMLRRYAARPSEGGSGRIGASQCRKAGSVGKGRGKVGRICFRRLPRWPIMFLIGAPKREVYDGKLRERML